MGVVAVMTMLIEETATGKTNVSGYFLQLAQGQISK